MHNALRLRPTDNRRPAVPKTSSVPPRQKPHRLPNRVIRGVQVPPRLAEPWTARATNVGQVGGRERGTTGRPQPRHEWLFRDWKAVVLGYARRWRGSAESGG